MSILDQLASALGRKDEVPNQELAKAIATAKNTKAIKELVEGLAHKSKAIQSDCIKVLYEIGEQQPVLIAPYFEDFLALLGHKNNRLQWGTMTDLNSIAKVKPYEVYKNLSLILDAADRGSVITRDQAVNILIHLTTTPKYAKDTFPLLLDQLLYCPTNQLPMYAERALPIIDELTKKEFLDVLQARLSEIEKDSKRKRVEKVIKKLSG